MDRIKLFQYTVDLDPNKTFYNESINLPSEIEEIIQVCPTISNGSACYGNNVDKPVCFGFLSIYNETNNEQILNTMMVVDDKAHYNYKAIDMVHFPQKNNLKYVFLLDSVDNTQDCTLRIVFKYKQRKK